MAFDSTKKRVTGDVYRHPSADPRRSVGFPFVTVDNKDIAVRDLDGDSSPEIVFMAYDAPPGPNTFRLRTWHW